MRTMTSKDATGASPRESLYMSEPVSVVGVSIDDEFDVSELLSDLDERAAVRRVVLMNGSVDIGGAGLRHRWRGRLFLRRARHETRADY